MYERCKIRCIVHGVSGATQGSRAVAYAAPPDPDSSPPTCGGLQHSLSLSTCSQGLRFTASAVSVRSLECCRWGDTVGFSSRSASCKLRPLSHRHGCQSLIIEFVQPVLHLVASVVLAGSSRSPTRCANHCFLHLRCTLRFSMSVCMKKKVFDIDFPHSLPPVGKFVHGIE